MLKMTSPTRLSVVLLSSLDMAEEDEFKSGGSNGMKFIITSKKTTRADYLNSERTVSNKSFGYLALDTKKAFNYLRHTVTKAPIFQHFDPERHI